MKQILLLLLIFISFNLNAQKSKRIKEMNYGKARAEMLPKFKVPGLLRYEWDTTFKCEQIQFCKSSQVVAVFQDSVINFKILGLLIQFMDAGYFLNCGEFDDDNPNIYYINYSRKQNK